MLTAGELGGTAPVQIPTSVLVEPRACVHRTHTFTLSRAPLYASDPSSSRTEKAGGGDVTAQAAALVFIFHFRGGSSQSSASVVVQKPGAIYLTLKLKRLRLPVL